MRLALAGWLCRKLVGCYPPRWRQRYGGEMLDVLGQHRAGARTVLNLAASVLSTHLDPAYRTEGMAMTRLRRGTLVCAAVVAPLVLLGSLFGYQAWQESHWHPDGNGGVAALAFSPDRRILVSAAGYDINGIDTVWNIARPAHPRRLASFEGGSPTALSPDGRTVATLSFTDEPVLWNVADPARPAKIATLPGAPGVLWGEAFSPDGRILATAYTSRIYLWDVANPRRPQRLRALAFDPAVPPDWHGFPGDITFSPDGRILACTTGRHQVGMWNVASPAQATRVATLTGHTAPVAAVAFSPRGHLLADVGYDGAVTVYRLTGPAHPAWAATIRTVAAARSDYTDTQYALVFSPDGHTLTVAADSTPPAPAPGPPVTARETVSRWEVTNAGTVTPSTTVSRDNTAAGQLALAPGGRTLARGSPFGYGDTVGLQTLP